MWDEPSKGHIRTECIDLGVLGMASLEGRPGWNNVWGCWGGQEPQKGWEGLFQGKQPTDHSPGGREAAGAMACTSLQAEQGRRWWQMLVSILVQFEDGALVKQAGFLTWRV